jgi:sulfide:quinone oxidoreductase
MKVVIAGGGVAGLEAMLALHELAADRVEIELLTPASEFVYRPMLVAEPFGTARALRLDLAPVVAEAGASQRREALAGVAPERRTVTTDAGTLVPYDALVLALGATPGVAVPGAITFDGGGASLELERLLRTLGSRHRRRIGYVVPVAPSWRIAAYELALMTAAERDERHIPGLEITLVTAETSPLGAFGAAASRLVHATLESHGIDLRPAARARRFSDGRLELEGDDPPLELDHVVALPSLTVPELPGLRQGEHGFIGTDVAMHVDGMEMVWAAGDATHFPIKHGGLASEQADVAARAIAARAGVPVATEPFRPVLRGALITGGAPEFLEAELWDPDGGTVSVGRPLWTPSIKLAARYLGPYIARALRGGQPSAGFRDIPPRPDAASEPGHDRAVAAAVAAADADAEHRDYAGALRWLSLVEQLELAIPAAYVTRREEWRRRLDPGAKPHPAAGRMDPSFATAEQALSDLHRRIGWMRDAERGGGDEMAARLASLEAGIEDLTRLSRRTGTLRG